MESAYNMVYLWKAAVEKVEPTISCRSATVGINLMLQGPIKMYPTIIFHKQFELEKQDEPI